MLACASSYEWESGRIIGSFMMQNGIHSPQHNPPHQGVNEQAGCPDSA
jgi:hypothetical protein